MMYSRAFIQGIEMKLKPLAPVVLPGIIKKQLTEVGATEDTLTPELAEVFIKKIEEALRHFLGPEGAKIVHKVLMKELRNCAPDYFRKTHLLKS